MATLASLFVTEKQMTKGNDFNESEIHKENVCRTVATASFTWGQPAPVCSSQTAEIALEPDFENSSLFYKTRHRSDPFRTMKQ